MWICYSDNDIVQSIGETDEGISCIRDEYRNCYNSP